MKHDNNKEQVRDVSEEIDKQETRRKEKEMGQRLTSDRRCREVLKTLKDRIQSPHASNSTTAHDIVALTLMAMATTMRTTPTTDRREHHDGNDGQDCTNAKTSIVRLTRHGKRKILRMLLTAKQNLPPALTPARKTKF